MSEFTNEEFMELVNKIPVHEDFANRPPYYSIIINGKIFITDKGKTVWKKKNHAMCAFNNQMQHIVQNYTKNKLKEEGVNVSDIWRHPEYLDCFTNFKEQLKKNDMINIIEI